MLVPEYHWTNTTRAISRALSSRSGYSVQRVSGFSLPDKDHLIARGPQQHGATYVDTFFQPRRCSLAIMIAGCDAEEFQAKHRELVRAMNPLDDGVLRIIAEDQTRYTLTCRPVTAITLRRHNARIGEALVQLVADDPFFYTPAEETDYLSALSAGLTIPFTIPAIISSPTNQATFTVSNDGDLPVYPTIYIRKIFSNPSFINDTTGETLTVSDTPAGPATLTVDMGQRTAIVSTFGGTINVLGSVSGTFWDLARGDNHIRVTSEAANIFYGRLTFSARYLAVI